MRMFSRSRRGGGDGGNNNNPTNYDSNNFYHQAETLIPAEVRMISGCHSEQTSADVSNVASISGQLPNPAGRAGGACTSALLDILYRHKNNSNHYYGGKQQPLTFQDLLIQLRSSLSDSGFDQIPQLTSSRPLELQQTPFCLVGNNGTAMGRRRALLVGINYRGQNGELSGCHNDIYNMKKYIIEEHGFPEYDILVLADDGRNKYPTRQKIILALRQMVAQSVPGDSVYFHYSGHGGLLEPDGNAYKNKSSDYDETIYPLDHEGAGHIRDFSLFNHFVKPMAAGVTVTCVMDCCHSGSVLDLPYSFQPTPSGEIMMRENFSSLSNLAFLYLLAGGMFPPTGFEGITEHLENTVDGDLGDYQGLGAEMEANDFQSDDVFMDENNFGEAMGGGDVDEAYADAADVADAADATAADAYVVPDENNYVTDGGDFGDGYDADRTFGAVDYDDGGGIGADDAGAGGDDIDCVCCLADLLGAVMEGEE